MIHGAAEIGDESAVYRTASLSMIKDIIVFNIEQPGIDSLTIE